jgi:hypothetical protein
MPTTKCYVDLLKPPSESSEASADGHARLSAIGQIGIDAAVALLLDTRAGFTECAPPDTEGRRNGGRARCAFAGRFAVEIVGFVLVNREDNEFVGSLMSSSAQGVRVSVLRVAAGRPR